MSGKPGMSKGKPNPENDGTGDQEKEDGEGADHQELMPQSVSKIVEGKREKKSVQRLNLQFGKDVKPLTIEEGQGMKLGEIEHVAYHIGRMKADELKPLHKILFNRPGNAASVKKNIRQFSGFTFEPSSDVYIKKSQLVKRLGLAGLRSICKILGLEISGNQDTRVERILTFLLNPSIRKRGFPKKKKKSSSKSKAIIDSSSEDEDGRKKKSGSEPKSREMIEDDDSSSDEEDEGTAQQSEKEGEEEEEDEGESEEKTPLTKKPSATGKKSLSTKKPAGPKSQSCKSSAKMTTKGRSKSTKHVEEEASEQSLSDNDTDNAELSKAVKRPAPVKKAAKTKKADSSSSKITSRTSKGCDAEDSSDDEPLIKLLKKPPNDEELKDTVHRLLNDANLEEVTMTEMYKKVSEAYPDHDLTSRKPLIKETVKKLIS